MLTQTRKSINPLEIGRYILIYNGIFISHNDIFISQVIYIYLDIMVLRDLAQLNTGPINVVELIKTTSEVLKCIIELCPILVTKLCHNIADIITVNAKTTKNISN